MEGETLLPAAFAIDDPPLIMAVLIKLPADPHSLLLRELALQHKVSFVLGVEIVPGPFSERLFLPANQL